MSGIPELARIRALIDSLGGSVVVLWSPSDDSPTIVCEASEMTNAEAVGFVEMAQAAMIQRIRERG